MFRLMLSLLLVCSLNSIGYSQLFPNAFWNKGKGFSQATQTCPNGTNCPSNVQSFSTANNVPGHWTYPGVSITRHLEQEHGVATAGLNRQQQLNLHDSLHEGGSQLQTIPHSVVIYGSNGSNGSSGSNVVNQQAISASTYGSISSSIASPLVASISTVEVIRKKNSFKTVFVEAVKRSREAGEINAIEAAALRLKANNSNFLRNAEMACADAAIAEGVVSATAQIDWDALLAFIEKLIPLILKLIDAFAYVQPYADYMYANSSSYYDFHTAA